MRLVALFALSLAVVACSSSGGVAVPTTASAPASATAPDPSAVRAEAPPESLATCPLALRTHELGDGASTLPSAPAPAGDGFVVAYTHFVDPHYELVTQRVGADGVLAPPIGHGARPGPWVPLLAGRGGDLVLVTGDGKTPEAAHLDTSGRAATTSVALPAWPDAMALGSRGLLTSDITGKLRAIRRGGAPDITVPSTANMPVPGEQLVASGDGVDVVLARSELGSGYVVSVVVVAPGAPTPTTYELFRTQSDREFGEVSVAAGPDGFLVVRAGPSIERLELYRLDPSGQRLGDPVTLAAAANEVTRYPRAASLGTGWLATYWDGTGPTLVRLDADARQLGERIPLRSGDERGGHTDARLAVSADTIAVSWFVGPPLMSHGFPEEEPKRPGPRLGILTCAASGATASGPSGSRRL